MKQMINTKTELNDLLSNAQNDKEKILKLENDLKQKNELYNTDTMRKVS